MNILNKKIMGNEAGNAGIAVIVIIVVIVLWFAFTTVLGWIQSGYEGKKQKNREMKEIRAQKRLPAKAYKAHDRSTVVKY